MSESGGELGNDQSRLKRVIHSNNAHWVQPYAHQQWCRVTGVASRAKRCAIVRSGNVHAAAARSGATRGRIDCLPNVKKPATQFEKKG